jgi:hypothetical protein
MFSALVNRIFRRREIGVRKCTDRNQHDSVITFLRVEYIATTNRAKPESKRSSLITRTDKFRSDARNLVGGSISGKRGENAPRSLLASKTVTNTTTQRLALNFNAELPAKAGRSFGRHENLEEMLALFLKVQPSLLKQ